MNTLDRTSRLRRTLENGIGYGTLGIAVVVLLLFLVYPVFVVVARAFFDKQGHFTLQYFMLLFENQLQTEAIWNSLKLAVATTVLTTVLAFPLAIFTGRWDFRGKGLLSALLLVPMVLPPFVGAIGIQRFFARRGSVNLTLMDWGIIDAPIDWLSGSHVFWAVVILEVLHLYPIMYLNLSAALANVDPSLEESAATLGASRWKRYKDIVWPLSRPGYFAGAIIVFVWALTDLGTPLLVGFQDTMPVRIFTMVTDVAENPVGYALVCLIIVLTLAIFLASRLFVGGKKFEMMGRGHASSASRRAGLLGTLGIYLVCGLTILVALIPHVSVLVTSLSDTWFMTPLPETYTTLHYQNVFNNELSFIGIKNSLLFSCMSTLVDIVLGLLIAYVVTRRLVPFGGVLDSLVMLPLALPGIVIAFGYVVAYSDTFLDPLNNPVPLLVIAYAIRRLPYMVRSAVAGLQQISPALEEASFTFGASRLHTLRKITGPLVLANLIAGALLCFAYAMLDVSDSLILAMKDKFYPITKAIYVLFLEQGHGEFTASALGMIAMGILVVCILGASLLLGRKMGELFRS